MCTAIRLLKKYMRIPREHDIIIIVLSTGVGTTFVSLFLHQLLSNVDGPWRIDANVRAKNARKAC